MYGKLTKELDDDQPTYVAFDNNNWAGWVFEDEISPGGVRVAFEDTTGHIDVYTNYCNLTAEQLNRNPPVSKAGVLNPLWALSVDPNKYHHSDFNAGRPSIGADHRWTIRNHPESSPTDCNLPEELCREQNYRWYPRDTKPTTQRYPLKKNGQVIQQLDKLEIASKYLFQHPITHWERSIESPSYEKCKKGRRLNEYVLEEGEPWRTNHPEQNNYVDPLINQSYLDQVIRACESLVRLVWPASDEWIENFLHYNAADWDDNNKYWTYGTIVFVPDYNVDGLYSDNCFFICTQTYTATPGDPKKPGTSAGADYWETPAYNPRYMAYNVEFPCMQDAGEDDIASHFVNSELSSAEYWDCNGSTFELCLKNLCEYDWYFDTGHPYNPWWMYKFRFDYASLSNSMPSPYGTWRRFPRYSMGRPKDFLLWPGELGDPPGYWEGRDKIYKRLRKRFIVTQAKYDAIEVEACREHYRVVDVEALYRQRVAEYGEEYVEGLLTTHDPQFEIHHDMLNHLRSVLVQLRYIFKSLPCDLNIYYHSATKTSGAADNPPGKDTSLAAHREAKEYALKPNHFEIITWGDYKGYVAIHTRVTWNVTLGKWVACSAYDAGWTRKAYTLLRLIFYEGDNKVLPSFPSLGTMLIHLKFNWYVNCVSNPAPPDTGKLIWEPCVVGVVDKTFKAKCSETGLDRYGFAGSDPSWQGWQWNNVTKKWLYWMYWWIMPGEPWPDESWFNGSDKNWTWHWRKKEMHFELTSGVSKTVPAMLEIDLEKYDKSVFEWDNTNFIEV